MELDLTRPWGVLPLAPLLDQKWAGIYSDGSVYCADRESSGAAVCADEQASPAPAGVAVIGKIAVGSTDPAASAGGAAIVIPIALLAMPGRVPHNVRMTQRGRPLTNRLGLPVVAVLILVLFLAWSTRPGTTTPVHQPDAGGYEYVVSDEHYVVPLQEGGSQVQERRRESWRAPDGWAWARQTGYDPARFIFAPHTEFEAIRLACPNVDLIDDALRQYVVSAGPSDIEGAMFGVVVSMFTIHSLPRGYLSLECRRALVETLDQFRSISVSENVRDPLGRESVRVTFTHDGNGSALTGSAYLDANYQLLAHVVTRGDSDDVDSYIITERGQAARIPDDLLRAVGDGRVETAVWD